MSRISIRLQAKDELDIIWKICFFAALIILVINISIYIKTLQHLHCIPEYSYAAKSRSKTLSNHMNTYSTLSISFAVFSAAINWLMYPICTEWSCMTWIGWMFNILYWDSYMLSKILLYSIFIGRLCNAEYRKIYSYPRRVHYLLWLLVIVLIMILISNTIGSTLLTLDVDYPDAIEHVVSVAYPITDIIISILTMILFFRPFCRGHMTSAKSVAFTALRKYCVLSVLQMIAAVSFQLSLMASAYLDFIDAPIRLQIAFVDIFHLIQNLDCLLLMICIYFGFARKQTV